MIIENQEQFNKECEARGWSAETYQGIVEEYIDKKEGVYGTSFKFHNHEYWGYVDKFELVKQPVWWIENPEGTMRRKVSWKEFRKNKNWLNKWDLVEEVEEPVYRFIPDENKKPEQKKDDNVIVVYFG